jgi:energy-coupling factor transporter ATP-binding protein EcfA2
MTARQLPHRHLSVRVPWHDTAWDGRVCHHPLDNSACLRLGRIAEERNDSLEVSRAGTAWARLADTDLPPCAAERAGFMAAMPRTVRKVHPYSSFSEHYRKFKPTTYELTPYSADCVPFRWMLREYADSLAERLRLDYRIEYEDEIELLTGHKTQWVQHGANQRVLLEAFFSALRPTQSLFFVYAKETPLSDDGRRVLLGVGRVASVGPTVPYEQDDDTFGSMVWERVVGHTIRPNRMDGFLMPYHELIEACRTTGSDIAEYVVHVDDGLTDQFSYASEHVTHDAAISALVALDKGIELAATRVPGTWDHVRSWISDRLAEVWRLRGPNPGLGAALEALGITNGVLVTYELQKCIGDNENAWPIVEKALADPGSFGLGDKLIGKTSRGLLGSLPAERRALLELISRFDLTPEQAKRLYDPAFRSQAGIHATDADLLANPYLFYELDRLALDPVGVLTIDHGVFPDDIVRDQHPLPAPSTVEEPIDARRVRALVVDALEQRGAAGHTLASGQQLTVDVSERELSPACPLSTDVLSHVASSFAPVVVAASMADGSPAFQLDRYAATKARISRIVTRRSQGQPWQVTADWRSCIDAVIGEPVASGDEDEERARQEKSSALEVLATSRFAVLIGPAGTGKTTLLRALCSLPEVAAGGVLLLAPTGKARVRMQQAIGLPAQTLAQFLVPSERYDGKTGRYQRSENDAVQGARTIVVDESSMLTEEQLDALLDGITGYDRLILVGDHRQLPPIGAGRPFVDIINHLVSTRPVPAFPRVAPSYAELTIGRRQADSDVNHAADEGEDRADRLLAEWFGGGELLNPAADTVWDRLKAGSPAVDVREWTTTTDLEQQLLAVLQDRLQLASPTDSVGFECSYGGTEVNGWVYFNLTKPTDGEPPGRRGAESWQILSPVKGDGPGTVQLNRFVQRTFRHRVLERARKGGWAARTPKPAGPQEIVYGDKVINVRNTRRTYYYPKAPPPLEYVANGEIGVVVGQFRSSGQRFKLRNLEVEFATQPGYKYDFPLREFSGEEGSPALELAYAITVHKSQGSEFDETIIVIPNPCRLLSRELLYTALTRQRSHLTLLHQGPLADLRALGSPAHSETATRLTNLFAEPNPVEVAGRFLEHRLIHRTKNGTAVRSKSEVIIADALTARGLAFKYEEPFTGADGATRFPDFTIVDDDTGETFLWEHLGMLHVPTYREKWEHKLAWYRDNGVDDIDAGGGLNGTLIITKDSAEGGISSADIDKKIEQLLS